MARVKVKKAFDDGWSDRSVWTNANGEVVLEGQLLIEASGEVDHMDAVAEDADFIGVALTGHSANPDDFRDSITVSQKCLIDIDVTSAAYVYGAGLKYSAGGPTTDYSLVADGGANTIAWAAETKTATRLLVYVDVWALGKQMGLVSA